jgi:hypothetical protein
MSAEPPAAPPVDSGRDPRYTAAMPLYLDEIWLAWNDADTARRALTAFRTMATTDFAFPEGVTLVAGPWFSNEEAKIVLVLDIADHAKTFASFTLATMHGLIAKRRLAPIVDWPTLQAFVRQLAPGDGG